MQVAARHDTPSFALHTRIFASRADVTRGYVLARAKAPRSPRAHTVNVFLRARFFAAAAAFLPPSRAYTRVHISSSLNHTDDDSWSLPSSVFFFFLLLFHPFFFYITHRTRKHLAVGTSYYRFRCNRSILIYLDIFRSLRTSLTWGAGGK